VTRLTVFSIVAIGVFVTGDASPAQAQARASTPEDLYQQAITRERAAGDIQGAIQLYRQVAASSDRALAARALLRLGEAYEKLGARESQAAYERIVRDFADQTEPANAARARLAALRSTTAQTARASGTAPSFAMLLAELPALRPSDAAQFDFSPSGEEVVFRRPMAAGDSLSGSAIEIAAGGGTVVRTLLPAEKQMGRLSPRWSPDGRHIAYLQRAFIGADTDFLGLMVVPAAGGTPRVVSTSLGSARPAHGGLFWTPDSRGISFWANQQLTTVDLDGKVLRSIPLRLRHRGQVTGYSPDGRWLAYHVMNDGSEQADEVDVWVVAAEGGEPVQVTSAPGYDGWPVWGADGRSLYFVSDRSGSRNVWRVEIDDRSGMPRGEPAQITSYADATILYPRTIGNGGKIAFALVREMSVIQVAATANPSAHRPLVRGTKPILSPDGRTVYFAGPASDAPGIFAVSVSGGTPRRLTTGVPGGGYLQPFALSKDGGRIAWFGRVGAQSVLSTVATAGGSPSEVTRFDSREHLIPAWSPDGTQLAFIHGTGLYAVPAGGGERRQLATMPGWEGWSVRWSPDGEHVAAFGWPEQPASSEQNVVYVVPARGGEPRRLTQREESGYKEGLEWHPDGRRLTYMYYGHDGRADETRVAYLDGRPTARMLDQPYPIWDYLGVWDPQGRTYYVTSSFRGTWGLYAQDDGSDTARTVWHDASVTPGASPPSFSSDGGTMVWSIASTTRQLWSVSVTR
jgi:Tol biopolymer transport system component